MDTAAARTSIEHPDNCSEDIREPIRFMFYEGDPPLIEVGRGRPFPFIPNGERIPTRGEDCQIEIAHGTAVMQRWLSLGMSYQHWAIRAICGGYFTAFPRTFCGAELDTVLSSTWWMEPGILLRTRTCLSLAPVDLHWPGGASYLALHEARETLALYGFTSELGCLLTVHSRSGLRDLKTEGGAIDKGLDLANTSLVIATDDLAGTDMPPFVSVTLTAAQHECG